jgi:hypothetical protein
MRAHGRWRGGCLRRRRRVCAPSRESPPAYCSTKSSGGTSIYPLGATIAVSRPPQPESGMRDAFAHEDVSAETFTTAARPQNYVTASCESSHLIGSNSERLLVTALMSVSWQCKSIVPRSRRDLQHLAGARRSAEPVGRNVEVAIRTECHARRHTQAGCDGCAVVALDPDDLSQPGRRVAGPD